MKIKKVDDKPMVIHTKKKAKIHTHDTKAASSNLFMEFPKAISMLEVLKSGFRHIL